MGVQMDRLATMSTAMPDRAELDMPVQSLSCCRTIEHGTTGLTAFLARVITFGGALGLTAYAGREMFFIVSQGVVTPLQWLMLGLFLLTFVWVAFAACAAIAGVVLPAQTPKAKLDTSEHAKTVLLMPVYNEEPASVCAALLAMGEALVELGYQDEFEIFIISDSNDPEVWVKETAAVAELKRRLADNLPVWYRRRSDNKAKKAGNVYQFVSTWGARYESMVVLDADSLIAAETLVTLRQEMAADPQSGIIQTLPVLYRAKTLFARMQQFAGAIYGPIVARGVAAWQGNDGNYWGHNAIIRVQAFASAAGLPTIKGVKPFAGDILSHDFVEAALIRRAGWSVRMLPTLPGSWEESPPTLTEVATRDRRWAQGNIQHLAVLQTKGLRWPNRFHMLMGVMSYLASPIWFALILVGIALAMQIQQATVSYFGNELSLLPTWPVFDSVRMMNLLVFTLIVLLLPKILGVLRALCKNSIRRKLGAVNICISAIVELFLSVLYAPIFMLIHCSHILDIFKGKDSGWATQTRERKSTDWILLFKRHFSHMLIGLMATFVVYQYAADMLPWLAPALIGMILAIPLSALSGNIKLASFLRWFRCLCIPEEIEQPNIITQRNRYVSEFDERINSIKVNSLLEVDEYFNWHFSMVSMPEQVKPGQPEANYLMADAKIKSADSSSSALDWMSKTELMSLLNHFDLFSKLRALDREAKGV